MNRLIVVVLVALLLSTLPVGAHGPEVTAVVTYQLSGQVVLRLIDPYGTTVTGRLIAQVESGAPNRPRLVRLWEDSQGTYTFDLGQLGRESFEVALEAILWNEIYRTIIVVDPSRAGQEILFGLREYPPVQRAGWGLVIYGGVTIGMICLLGVLLVRRQPA